MNNISEYISIAYDDAYPGFYKYSHLGTGLKNNLTLLWKQHYYPFIVEGPSVCPFPLMKVLGYTDRFNQPVVEDEANTVYLATEIVKNYFVKNGLHELAHEVEKMPPFNLQKEINSRNILPPRKDRKSHKVTMKNCMYPISQNVPNEKGCDFLNPDLAYNVFLQFDDFVKSTQKVPPFGMGTLGKVYNTDLKKISREENICLEEWFYDDNVTQNSQWLNKELPILAANMQINGDKQKMISINEIIDTNIVTNAVVADKLYQGFAFAKSAGLKEHMLRLRESMPNELNHYAVQSWYLEGYLEGRWISFITITDRGTYDLQILQVENAKRELEEPIEKTVLKLVINIDEIKNRYRDLTSDICAQLNSMSQEELSKIKKKGSIYVYVNDLMCVITNKMFKLIENKTLQKYERYIPNIVESLLNMESIIGLLIDHHTWDNKLHLPDRLNPYRYVIFPTDDSLILHNLVTKIQNSGFDSLFYPVSKYEDLEYQKKLAEDNNIQYLVIVDPGSLDDDMITLLNLENGSQNRIEIQNIKYV